MSQDALAATIAILNQRIKALIEVIQEMNETLSKGADDDGTGEARSG